MTSPFPDSSSGGARIIRRVAPGKINLRLKVTARRDDGYHELQTLFIPLRSPADIVTTTVGTGQRGISVSSEPAILPAGSGNICHKAAELYCLAAGMSPDGISIHIKKVIPVAAGLGGGSSDAAAVLLALQEHFNALSGAELASLAVGVGADVPFFLYGRPASATGVGEKLLFLEFDPTRLPLVIAAPDFPVSAAWAYRSLDRRVIGSDADAERIIAALHDGDWSECARLMHNDLSCALYEKFPLLRLLRHEFCNAGALGAEISGSGPSMLAMFADHAGAAAGAAAVRAGFDGRVRVFLPWADALTTDGAGR